MSAAAAEAEASEEANNPVSDANSGSRVPGSRDSIGSKGSESGASQPIHERLAQADEGIRNSVNTESVPDSGELGEL